MRKIILYIAMSMDGKIAEIDGNTSWLDEVPNPDESDYGYSVFYNSIDTTLMGNSTYKQILGFDVDFPYAGKTNYVFTRDKEKKKDVNVEYISENPIDFIKELKYQEGSDIWLVGGGQLNTLLLNHNLIDEMIIFVMPVLLGNGLPLFADIADETKIEFSKSKTYNGGVIELRYKIK